MASKTVVIVASAVGLAVVGGAAAWFALGGCVASCGADPTTGSKDQVMALICERSCAAKGPYEASAVAAQPGAAEGALTRCPVSGVVFTLTQESPRVAASGREWRTCCDTCATKLSENPTKFLGT